MPSVDELAALLHEPTARVLKSSVVERELQEAIWNDVTHPRWPPGTKDAAGKPVGGQFMRAGQRFDADGHLWEIAQIAKGHVIATEASGVVANAETRVFDPTIKTFNEAVDAVGGKHPTIVGVTPAKPKALTAGSGKGSQTASYNSPVADAVVYPKTHDPKLLLPEGSSLTAEDWKGFGRSDQLYYQEVMQRYGKWSSKGSLHSVSGYDGGVWQSKMQSILTKANQDFGSHTASALVTKAFGANKGSSSSGKNLALVSVFESAAYGGGPELAKAQELYANAREVESEINGLLAWDLYNRTRSPDVTLIHNSNDHEGFFGSIVAGKDALMSSASHSWAGTWDEPNAIAHAVPIRLVSFSEQLLGDYGAAEENEFSSADRLRLSPDTAAFWTSTQVPKSGQVWKWVQGQVKANPAGGHMIRALAAHLAGKGDLPLPPATPDFVLKHGGVSGVEKTYTIPPDAFMAKVEAAVKKNPGKVVTEKIPISELGLKPGDVFESTTEGLRYLVIADPGTNTGLRYLALGKGAVGNYDSPDKNYTFTSMESTKKRVDLHFDIPPPVAKEKGAEPAAYDPALFKPAGEPVAVKTFAIGDRLRFNNDDWEVTSQSSTQTTIRSLSDSKLEATVNGLWKTQKLGVAFEPKTGVLAVLAGTSPKVVVVGKALKLKTAGDWMVTLPDGATLNVPAGSLGPLPAFAPGKAQKGDVFAYSGVGDPASTGVKMTVTNVLKKNGHVRAKAAGGKVQDFAPDDPALAGLFRISDYALGPKAKLGSFKAGALFSGSAAKQHPYMVLGSIDKVTHVKNLETGELSTISKYKSFPKLLTLAEVQPVEPAPTDMTGAGVAHDQLQVGDKVLLSQLKVGDQFGIGGSVMYQIVGESELNGVPMWKYKKAGQPNTSVDAIKKSAAESFLYGGWASLFPVPSQPVMPAVVADDLPNAVDFGFKPFKSNAGPGGKYKHDKLKMFAAGTLVLDSGGKPWMVKKAGATPIMSDGVKLFQVDGNLRAKDAVHAKKQPVFLDMSPGVDGEQAAADLLAHPDAAGGEWVVTSGYKNANSLSFKVGDQFKSSSGVLHTVTGFSSEVNTAGKPKIIAKNNMSGTLHTWSNPTIKAYKIAPAAGDPDGWTVTANHQTGSSLDLGLGDQFKVPGIDATFTVTSVSATEVNSASKPKLTTSSTNPMASYGEQNHEWGDPTVAAYKKAPLSLSYVMGPNAAKKSLADLGLKAGDKVMIGPIIYTIVGPKLSGDTSPGFDVTTPGGAPGWLMDFHVPAMVSASVGQTQPEPESYVGMVPNAAGKTLGELHLLPGEQVVLPGAGFKHTISTPGVSGYTTKDGFLLKNEVVPTHVSASSPPVESSEPTTIGRLFKSTHEQVAANTLPSMSVVALKSGKVAYKTQAGDWWELGGGKLKLKTGQVTQLKVNVPALVDIVGTGQMVSMQDVPVGGVVLGKDDKAYVVLGNGVQGVHALKLVSGDVQAGTPDQLASMAKVQLAHVKGTEPVVDGGGWHGAVGNKTAAQLGLGVGDEFIGDNSGAHYKILDAGTAEVVVAGGKMKKGSVVNWKGKVVGSYKKAGVAPADDATVPAKKMKAKDLVPGDIFVIGAPGSATATAGKHKMLSVGDAHTPPMLQMVGHPDKTYEWSSSAQKVAGMAVTKVGHEAVMMEIPDMPAGTVYETEAGAQIKKVQVTANGDTVLEIVKQGPNSGEPGHKWTVQPEMLGGFSYVVVSSPEPTLPAKPLPAGAKMLKDFQPGEMFTTLPTEKFAHKFKMIGPAKDAGTFHLEDNGVPIVSVPAKAAHPYYPLLTDPAAVKAQDEGLIPTVYGVAWKMSPTPMAVVNMPWTVGDKFVDMDGDTHTVTQAEPLTTTWMTPNQISPDSFGPMQWTSGGDVDLATQKWTHEPAAPDLPADEFVPQPKAPLVSGIPNYEHVLLTPTGSAGGTTGAQFAESATGDKWLLKSYGGDQDRVATELLANAVYRELGVKAASAGTVKNGLGGVSLAYPLMPGETKTVWTDPMKKALAQDYVADALLANYDVHGLDRDNILWNGDEPTRVDQGGTLFFRAQGKKKEFGSLPSELFSMLLKGQPGDNGLAWNMSESDLRTQAAGIADTLTLSKIDELVAQAPFADKGMKSLVRSRLKSRVKWLSQFGDGKYKVPVDVKLAPDPTFEEMPPLVAPTSGIATFKSIAIGDQFYNWGSVWRKTSPYDAKLEKVYVPAMAKAFQGTVGDFNSFKDSEKVSTIAPEKQVWGNELHSDQPAMPIVPYASKWASGGAFQYQHIKDLAPGTLFRDKAGSKFMVAEKPAPDGVTMAFDDTGAQIAIPHTFTGKAGKVMLTRVKVVEA